MPRRLPLEGEDLEALRAQARARYPHGRIVSAERVRTGGIGRFLTRQHYELVVELPDPPPAAGLGGLAGLLADADAVEESLRPSVSTQSRRFADLLDSLTADTGVAQAPGPAPRLPLPFTGSGDLVLVLGADGTGVPVARAMQQWAGAPLAAAVALGGADPEPPVQLRHRMMRARAAGVEEGYPTFASLDLGPFGEHLARWAGALPAIAADQVWLVVDARMKPSDTQRWLHEVLEVVDVHGLAVQGGQATQTPHTVHELDRPVGWSDGSPAVQLSS